MKNLGIWIWIWIWYEFKTNEAIWGYEKFFSVLYRLNEESHFTVFFIFWGSNVQLCSWHVASSPVYHHWFRFVQGIVIQGLQCVSYSMIMELFCPAYRTLAGCVAEAFWAGGTLWNIFMFKLFFNPKYVHVINIIMSKILWLANLIFF